MRVEEGYMSFKGSKTYYRIIGESTGNKKPLVFLHGGPGSTHVHFEVLDRLAEEDGRQLIMYDQIGCGNSYVDNRPELWVKETWVEEFIELRKHLGLDDIHLLGQSWGGMLLLEYVCNYAHEGLKSLILSSTLPASWLWGQEQRRMIKELPVEMQNAIDTAVETNNYSEQEYINAEAEYTVRHVMDPITEASPQCLRQPIIIGNEAYVTAWGPNEFTPLGTLKDFDVTKKLETIKEHSLIISGGNDSSTPYTAKYMYDRIPGAKWELFPNSRHMCFIDENDGYVELLKKWLNGKD